MKEAYMTETVTCRDCKYSGEFTNENIINGSSNRIPSHTRRAYVAGCHRYPQQVIVEDDYWCGEFSPK